MKLEILLVVLDAAVTREPRPLQEFFKWPALPIREVYITRMLINAVWFARNYMNVFLMCVLFAAVWYPFLILLLVLAVLVHWSKRLEQRRVAAGESGQTVIVPTPNGPRANAPATGTSTSSTPAALPRILKILQFFACGGVLYAYGVFFMIVGCLVPTVAIAAHMVLTPYTDEASQAYEDALRGRGLQPPAPRSPTIDFAKKDKMFTGVLALDKAARPQVDRYAPARRPSLS